MRAAKHYADTAAVIVVDAGWVPYVTDTARGMSYDPVISQYSLEKVTLNSCRVVPCERFPEGNWEQPLAWVREIEVCSALLRWFTPLMLASVNEAILAKYTRFPRHPLGC
jgi:hypothetical protein